MFKAINIKLRERSRQVPSPAHGPAAVPQRVELAGVYLCVCRGKPSSQCSSGVTGEDLEEETGKNFIF